MKCHGCKSPMILDKAETAGRVTTEWHSCPICNKVKMHSELSDIRAPDSRWNELEEAVSEHSSMAYSQQQDTTHA